MQILCRTLFDITQTGTTGHFKPSHVPTTDRAGQAIVDHQTWTKSRNQQRNLETITQILQLRTQIFNATVPAEHNGYWTFSFEVEFENIYQLDDNEFGILKQDAEGVPMLVGLTEEYALTPVLTTEGSQQNIWFETIAINN